MLVAKPIARVFVVPCSNSLFIFCIAALHSTIDTLILALINSVTVFSISTIQFNIVIPILDSKNPISR